MPVPHFNIKITQRSKGNSAVAGAAYQAGEKLFSEYDQKTKNYTCKKEVVYTEIMLPPNAPPEYADRATLWNSVEEIEKQWNSQLARRFVAALPREVPMELLPQMVKEYCEEQFVSKGMCCDFAIHDPDPPGHNPHCHFMLTMRAIDENGKWIVEKVIVGGYDSDGNKDPYMIVFVYKTGFKNSVDGKNFKPLRKNSKENHSPAVLCSHASNEAESMCSDSSDDTCGMCHCAFQG